MAEAEPPLRAGILDELGFLVLELVGLVVPVLVVVELALEGPAVRAVRMLLVA